MFKNIFILIIFRLRFKILSIVLYMNLKTFKKVQLQQNQKRPLHSQNNPNNWNDKLECGAILTGKYTYYNNEKVCHNNNISVVDIDFFKKQSKEEQTINPFIVKFGFDFIDTFNTYTVKTQSGGYHLYFKYENLPTCVSAQCKKNIEVDFLNDGRYVVGPGCVVSGNSYNIYKDVDIKKMPSDLYDFIKNTLPKEQNIKTKRTYKKQKIQYNNNFSYDISEEVFNNIIEGMPDKYFSTYSDYLKFTTFCKILNRKKQWDDISKSKPGYNFNENFNIWDNCKCNINIVSEFLKYTDKHKSYFMYKPLPLTKNFKPDISINREKLGYDFIEEYMENCDCLVVKSDTGTGKSTSVGSYLEKTQNNFISIVSRVSLGQEQSDKIFRRRFNLSNLFYKDHKGEFETGDNIVIQLESIRRIAYVDTSDYILFLDEFSSILEHLLKSSTLDNRRVLVFNLFMDVIKNSKFVLAVDADINEKCIEFLKDCGRNVKYIKNNYKHNNNIKCEELGGEDDIIEKLKEKNKFFVCCDSKAQAEKINFKLNDKSIKLITSDIIEYIDLDKYDKIIISPKIIYGLDSTIKRNVYCVYREKTISPPQMIQQIARVRNIKKLYYCFINKTISQPMYNNLDECIKCLKYSKNLAIKEFQLTGCSDDKTNFYINYLASVEYRLDCYNTNKSYHFRKLLKDRGFIEKKIKYLAPIKTDKKKELEVKEAINMIKMEDYDKYTKEINTFLNIPKDKLKDYSKLFLDPFELNRHFNIRKFFYKYDLSEDVKFDIQKTAQDFTVNVTKSSKSKLYFLKLLLEKTEAIEVQPTKTLTPEDSKELIEKYKCVFRLRCKDPNFTKMNDINKTLNKIYKDLFKDYINVSRKGKKREYSFIINKEEEEYHKTIFNYSNNINDDDDDFIEDDDNDGVDHLKILCI